MDRADYGLIDTNTFCSSNSNLDIDIGTSIGTLGDNNTCEKPGVWNDSGTTGCTHYCDTPAESILLYPFNNYINYDDDVDLICKSTDNSKLVNVTLYHNISGIWQANETKNISGISNITTFSISNLNDTTFIWNCLSYDNKSRGRFAEFNWSLNVIVMPDDTHKFYVKDPIDNSVAWLGTEGNIVLKGHCFSGTSCTATGTNSFILKNTTDNPTAYINSTGDLCVSIGDCSDQSATCNPTKNAFIIQNQSTQINMSYITIDGDLCLTGGLYENAL